MKCLDISVVIQGKFDDKTVKSCKAIRKYLPEAEIILCTENNIPFLPSF